MKTEGGFRGSGEFRSNRDIQGSPVGPQSVEPFGSLAQLPARRVTQPSFNRDLTRGDMSEATPGRIRPVNDPNNIEEFDNTQQSSENKRRDERSGPITKVYKLLPHLRAQIDQVEVYLRGVKEKLIDPQKEKNPVLSDPETASQLRTAYSELDNKTPLQVVREQIEFDDRPILMPQTQPLPHNEAVMGKRLSATGHYYRRRPDPGIPMIRDKTHLEDFPPATTQAIHLVDQSVINLSTLQALLTRYPNLRVIEIPPSHLRLITPSYKTLLDGKGIELRIQRTRDDDFYDETRETHEYKVKKALYKSLFTRQETKGLMDTMKKHEFIELEIAERYFGKERIPISKIAEALGVNHQYVQKLLQIINGFAGYPIENAHMKGRAEYLKQRIARIQEAELNDAIRDAYRRSFSVGGNLPPLSLPMSAWDNWQKLSQLRQADNVIFDELRSFKPRDLSIVMDYYGLSGEPYTRKTYENLGKEYGISHERIRQVINEVLTTLGVLDE